MKKISFVFAFLLTASLAFAQQAYNHGPRHQQRGNVGVNEYRGGGSNHYRGGNHNYRGNSRHVRTNTRHVRTNQRWGSTTTVRGGVSTRTNWAPRQRVRWEYSPCGTYRYRITERCDYRPGRWVYTNGCRRWVEPAWSSWHVVCRDRFVVNSCGW